MGSKTAAYCHVMPLFFKDPGAPGKEKLILRGHNTAKSGKPYGPSVKMA